MDVSAIIATISKVIKAAVDLGPTVIQLEKDAAPFAEAIWNTISGKNKVTADELAALEAQVDALSADLQKPLPADTGA